MAKLPTLGEAVTFIAEAKVNVLLLKIRLSTLVILTGFLVIFYGLGWNHSMKTSPGKKRREKGL